MKMSIVNPDLNTKAIPCHTPTTAFENPMLSARYAFKNEIISKCTEPIVKKEPFRKNLKLMEVYNNLKSESASHFFRDSPISLLRNINSPMALDFINKSVNSEQAREPSRNRSQSARLTRQQLSW